MLSAMLTLLLVLMTACGTATEEGSVGSDAASEPAEASEAPAASEGAAECDGLEGETVTLIVPYSPGGGYDAYARLLAPGLSEQIGAEVIVENQDGAGGLLAINSLVTEEPDGTRIAIMNGVGAGGGALAGAEGVQFELDQLSYIGRVGASYHILSTAADSPYATFDDVRGADGLRYGSTGPGAADFVNGNLLEATFELGMEIITGFEGSEENELAVTRGDVDLMTGDFDSRLPVIENGDHRPLLLIGPEPDPLLPDTPALLELDLDDRQRTLAQFQVDLLDLGRSIVGPPGMPADALGCVRGALAGAVEDPELRAQAESTGRPLSYLPGEEMEALTRRLLEAPEEPRQVLERAYSG